MKFIIAIFCLLSVSSTLLAEESKIVDIPQSDKQQIEQSLSKIYGNYELSDLQIQVRKKGLLGAANSWIESRVEENSSTRTYSVLLKMNQVVITCPKVTVVQKNEELMTYTNDCIVAN